MKVLFITTQFPYPLDNGGKIGAYNGLSVVSRDFDVTVLSFTEEPQIIREGLDFLKKQMPTVQFIDPIIHDVHIRKKPIKLVLAILGGYFKRLPYIVSKFIDQKMFSLLDEIFLGNVYWDYIFIDYLNMNSYGDYIRKYYSNKIGKIILKDHNIEYELVKQEANSSVGLKILLEFEWRRTQKYEHIALNNANIVFSVCKDNTNYMRKINDNSYTMLPTYKCKNDREYCVDTHNILYIGNLSWEANMNGLKWFVNSVLPIIKSTYPDVILTVVGSGSAENPFVGNEMIDYKGYVKDISKIYDGQSVFIVPLFEGSGIRIKILEAFDKEIAVVSTTVGCKTIEANNRKELLIADTETEFADAVIELFNNHELNKSLVNNAKLFLREYYSLEKRQDEFAAHVAKS